MKNTTTLKHNLNTSDGVTIAAREFIRPDTERETCLVVMPGFAQHSGTNTFTSLCKELASKADYHHVVCIDPRGTGLSGWPLSRFSRATPASPNRRSRSSALLAPSRACDEAAMRTTTLGVLLGVFQQEALHGVASRFLFGYNATQFDGRASMSVPKKISKTSCVSPAPRA